MIFRKDSLPESPTDMRLREIKRPVPKMWEYVIVDDPQDAQSSQVCKVPPECIKADRDCNRSTRFRKNNAPVPGRSRAIQIRKRTEDCFDSSYSMCWGGSWLLAGID